MMFIVNIIVILFFLFVFGIVVKYKEVVDLGVILLSSSVENVLE